METHRSQAVRSLHDYPNQLGAFFEMHRKYSGMVAADEDAEVYSASQWKIKIYVPN